MINGRPGEYGQSGEMPGTNGLDKDGAAHMVTSFRWFLQGLSKLYPAIADKQ